MTLAKTLKLEPSTVPRYRVDAPLLFAGEGPFSVSFA